jgi:hypothetical protein
MRVRYSHLVLSRNLCLHETNALVTRRSLLKVAGRTGGGRFGDLTQRSQNMRE